MLRRAYRIVFLAAVAASFPSVCFAQCEPLVVRYDGGNWWWGAFGQCKQHGGTTDHNAIFECAWNQVPAADRTACLKQRLRNTEQTRQAIDDVAAFNGPANSCDQTTGLANSATHATDITRDERRGLEP